MGMRLKNWDSYNYHGAFPQFCTDYRNFSIRKKTSPPFFFINLTKVTKNKIMIEVGKKKSTQKRPGHLPCEPTQF